FFFSSRRRHTRFSRDWSSDVCSSDLSMYRPTYKTLSELGVEETKLAGLRINAKAHISSTETYFDALSLSPAGSKEVIEIALPERSEERRVGKECRSRRAT